VGTALSLLELLGVGMVLLLVGLCGTHGAARLAPARTLR
jgi:hypothetical protein